MREYISNYVKYVDSIINDNKYKESYHEIHEIDNIYCLDHIIATIDSIVSNNLRFKTKDTKLNSVIISGDNMEMINKVISHYENNNSEVDIFGAETAYMNMYN